MLNASRPALAEKSLSLVSATPATGARATDTSSAKDSAPSQGLPRGDFVIGKLNLVLMGIIGLILLALLSREESLPELPAVSAQHVHPTAGGLRLTDQPPATSDAPSSPANVSSQAASPASDHPNDTRTPRATTADAAGDAPHLSPPSQTDQLHTSSAATSPASVTEKQEPAAPIATAPETKSATKTVTKRRKKTSSAGSVKPPESHASAAGAAHQQTLSPETQETPAEKEAVRKQLVFNIWSVSELRLRTAYASYLNDSSIPAAELETRKRDYLNVVSQRSKKCGELDNKFLSNINTYEKLTMQKHDIDVLQCHATENNVVLDKLNR